MSGTVKGRAAAPARRVAAVAERALGLFPARVWSHFTRNRGFVLAAGVSYQALFAIFATLYVAFASVGLWLGANTRAIDALIALIDSYLPGLIGENGVLTEEQVYTIAQDASALLSITGLIAVIVFIWTAIGWISYSRLAVRAIFDLPPDTRQYVLLKARDFVMALVFSLMLLAGGVLSSAGSWFLSTIFAALGWSTMSPAFGLVIGLATNLVAFAVNTLTIAGIFKFLAGASVPWRLIVPGAALGGAATVVLQLAAGYLLSSSPSNPLLATFAVFIGLLLWCRFAGVVLLVAASWVAVTVTDAGLSLAAEPAPEREEDVRIAEVLAAVEKIRDATAQRRDAPFYRRRAARRREEEAIAELEDLLRGDAVPVGAGSSGDGTREEGSAAPSRRERPAPLRRSR
ncbi:YihY/virulence factor BrkB family protein [Occultella glacieicola]|uniref:YihY/virulence factor BrkB family protein n=1 Tax=Occultella glacieicola TaxID=2518684 RepID=A0ABY2E9P4_9MICO|nr:YihY/virulence factor BrkB family protein [Occultella glacieicola]TDE99008.1 YihY/virulence factor BrkB family protein [Occultella glacieicola]